LIFALGAGRGRKQEERGKEEVSVHAFHINVDAKAGQDVNGRKVRMRAAQWDE
jgi:hypothetical protein